MWRTWCVRWNREQLVCSVCGETSSSLSARLLKAMLAILQEKTHYEGASKWSAPNELRCCTLNINIEQFAHG